MMPSRQLSLICTIAKAVSGFSACAKNTVFMQTLETVPLASIQKKTSLSLTGAIQILLARFLSCL